MKYLEVEVYSKMNFLWSFIKKHKLQKILVLMATSEQVKYAFQAICKMNPGVNILALFKSMNTSTFMDVCSKFSQQYNAVLLATETTIRGSNYFSNVNWIVQFDCPPDTNTYIRQAFNTVSYATDGEALLILLPSEKESMLDKLADEHCLIEELEPFEFHDVQNQLKDICAADNLLHECACKAFKAYLKKILLMKDKTVFDLEKINFEMYAKSLGLKDTPRSLTFKKCLKSATGVVTGSTSEEYLLRRPVDSEKEEKERPTKRVRC